jgi:hypothetical protein
VLRSAVPAYAQADELAQLALNIQKLNQLRQILTSMKKGYEIITKGYNTVKSLSEGNFNIHQTFLDGLMAVNPGVKKYKRVADIILMQQQLIRDYKAALSSFRNLDVFNSTEIEAMEKVYANLFDRSAKNLEELLLVITANKLRMDDAGRIAVIDRIYSDMKDKLDFLHYYNNSNAMLSMQRQQERSSIRHFEQINAN